MGKFQRGQPTKVLGPAKERWEKQQNRPCKYTNSELYKHESILMTICFELHEKYDQYPLGISHHRLSIG